MRLGGNVGVDNTAGLALWGKYGISRSLQQLTESWNGTSWTEVNDLNTARDGVRGGGTNTLQE